MQWLRLEWESKSELTFRTEPLACNTVQHVILSNTIQHHGDVKTRVPLSQPTQRPDMGARIRTPGHLDNPPDFWSPKHWSLETFGHQNAPHWKPLVTKSLWGTFVVWMGGCGTPEICDPPIKEIIYPQGRVGGYPLIRNCLWKKYFEYTLALFCSFRPFLVHF